MKSRLIPETVPYAGAMEMLDCGRTNIYELGTTGELVSLVHAGKRRIDVDSSES